MTTKAIFLDKDGVLVEDVPYNVNLELIRFMDGAVDSLRLLQDAGYRLIIVSNQPGVARGFFGEEEVLRVKEHLFKLLANQDIFLTDFYYCPHYPDGKVSEYAIECSCRKPQPGMLMRAATQHQIDLRSSWLVGDILDDIETGKRAGCRTALLDNQHETEWVLTALRRPDLIVKNLHEAAQMIACKGSLYPQRK